MVHYHIFPNQLPFVADIRPMLFHSDGNPRLPYLYSSSTMPPSIKSFMLLTRQRGIPIGFYLAQWETLLQNYLGKYFRCGDSQRQKDLQLMRERTNASTDTVRMRERQTARQASEKFPPDEKQLPTNPMMVVHSSSREPSRFFQEAERDRLTGRRDVILSSLGRVHEVEPTGAAVLYRAERQDHVRREEQILGRSLVGVERKQFVQNYDNQQYNMVLRRIREHK
jgi:hypothetical protein